MENRMVFARDYRKKKCVCVLSHSPVSDFVTPWTVAFQVPLSMKFPRQEYWSEWVAISFSRVSSQPRDRTHVFCIVGRFFPTKPHGEEKFV